MADDLQAGDDRASDLLDGGARTTESSDPTDPTDGPDEPGDVDRPPTLASLARAARERAASPAVARPADRTPPARPADTAAQPSPTPTPPAPNRSGPPPPPPPGRSAPTISPDAGRPTTPDEIDAPAERPWFAPPKAEPGAPPAPPAASSDVSLPAHPEARPVGTAANGSPAPTPPRSANPPPAPPPPMDREDLSDILDRLHDDFDLEPSPAPKAPGEALTDPRDLERPTDRNAIVVESTGGLEFRPTFASYGSRFLGLVIDTIVVGLAVLPGVLVATLGGGGLAVAAGVLLALAGFLAMAAWYGRSVAESAQWFGNRVAGTKVVDSRNGRTVDRAHATTRFILRGLVSPIFLFGFVMALFDGQRRAFHDTFAGTVVTTRERQTWSADDETT